MKVLFSLIFFNFSLLLFSQNENSLKLGHAEEVKKDSIKITENKTVGYSDITFGKVKGKVSDNSPYGVESVKVTLTNLATKALTTCETNEDGLYDIDVENGIYSALFFQRSYGKFEIKKIDLNECQIQEININLGSRITIIDSFIVPAQEYILPSKKKEKKKKNLNENKKILNSNQ